jgi:pimeloyl-ACP methyl ester carboxylesterase
MMRLRQTLSLLLLLSTLGARAATAAPQIAGTTSQRDAGLVRTEYLVQVTPHPLDRFRMIRLVKDVPASSLRGSILLLPPLGTNFSFYEQRDPNGARGTSIAEFFALRGFDVYGYSPRFEAIPAPLCEAGLADCSVMAGWDLQSMLDDIAFIRAQIEQLHPGTRIVAGGASLGGMLAVAVANAAPGDYDGVIPWEGMLSTSDPTVRAINQGYCATLEAQIAGGAVYDGVGTNVFKQVAKQSELAPQGLNLIPLFPPTLTQHQVLVLLVAVPNPGPFTMPAPNYVLMNGSLAEDRLFHASEARLYDDIARFNGYVPLALVRDLNCSLAGSETAFTSNLAAFTGSVLAIGGGRGFGPYLPDQLAAFTHAQTTFLFEPDFGHIDHFMTADHQRYVEQPIFEWASRLFRQP